MATTANYGWTTPDSTSNVNLWTHFKTLADAIDTTVDSIDDRVDALDSNPAWASYSPAWTSTGTAPALGNGTLTGAYRQTGSTVHFRLLLTTGGTSTYGTGTYRFSLPVGGKIGSLLNAQVVDTSAGARYTGNAIVLTTSTTGANMVINVHTSTSTVGATVPFTFASGDVLALAGTYELA